MKYVQIVVLEPPAGCNMTDRHPECPAGVLGREQPVDLRIEPETAVQVAVELTDLGFRGQFGFHWFSEPLVSESWVRAVINGIRFHRRRSRFILWTNGSLITSANEDFVATFDHLFISNYDGRHYTGLQARCGAKLTVWAQPIMDPDVMTPPDAKAPPVAPRCYRAFNEFIVTRTGDVHLCCQAWRPEQSIGNVFRDGVPVCVERYRQCRADGAAGRKVEVGHPCIGCARPDPRLDSVRYCSMWDPVIAHEAAEVILHG